MTDALSREIAAEAAERFGLTMVEGTDGHALSLLFVGEQANEASFRQVLAYMLVDRGVTHQFSPHNDIPGIYVRGVTPPDTFTAIYLVVVGDPNGAQYVPMRPATRSGE